MEISSYCPLQCTCIHMQTCTYIDTYVHRFIVKCIFVHIHKSSDLDEKQKTLLVYTHEDKMRNLLFFEWESNIKKSASHPKLVCVFNAAQ